MICLEAEVDPLFIGEVPIHAIGHQPLAVHVRRVGGERVGTGNSLSKDAAAGRRSARECRPASQIPGGILQRTSTGGDRLRLRHGRVSLAERRLIQTCGGGGSGTQRVSLKFRRRDGHVSAGGQNIAQTFGIGEEEQLVLQRRAAERRRVIIGNGMGPRKVIDVVKEIVGVQQRAVPVLLQIAVELVRPRPRDEIHVGAGVAPVFDAVAVLHYRSFGNLILAQQKIAGAGVIQVQVGIVIVVPVDSEQVRGAGQSVRAEVPVPAARVDRDAGDRERHSGDVATRRREVFYLRGVEAPRKIRVLRIHHGRLIANLNHFLRRLQLGSQIHRGDLSKQDSDARFLRLQTRGLR